MCVVGEYRVYGLMLSTVVQNAYKARISVLTLVSLLARKMKHGNLYILSFLVIRSKRPPIEKEQEPLPQPNPRGKHIS